MKKLFNFLWGSIEVINSADGPTQMAIYDMIGKDDFSGGGITDVDFSNALIAANNMQDLHIHVNSKGGDVHHGMSMRNGLKSWKQKTGRKVTTIIDGIAASTASWAFPTASDEVKAYKGSQVFVHEAMALAAGSAENFRDTADILDKTSMQIADMYAEKSGKPASFWRNKMKSGSLMTGDEAKGEGLVDSIIDGNATNFGPWVETVKKQLVIQNQLLNYNENHDERGRFSEGSGGSHTSPADYAEAKKIADEKTSKTKQFLPNMTKDEHLNLAEAHHQAADAHRTAAGKAKDDNVAFGKHMRAAEGHDFDAQHHELKAARWERQNNKISSAPTQGAENQDTINIILNFNPPEKSALDLISSAVAGQ